MCLWFMVNEFNDLSWWFTINEFDDLEVVYMIDYILYDGIGVSIVGF